MGNTAGGAGNLLKRAIHKSSPALGPRPPPIATMVKIRFFPIINSLRKINYYYCRFEEPAHMRIGLIPLPEYVHRSTNPRNIFEVKLKCLLNIFDLFISGRLLDF